MHTPRLLYRQICEQIWSPDRLNEMESDTLGGTAGEVA